MVAGLLSSRSRRAHRSPSLRSRHLRRGRPHVTSAGGLAQGLHPGPSTSRAQRVPQVPLRLQRQPDLRVPASQRFKEERGVGAEPSPSFDNCVQTLERNIHPPRRFDLRQPDGSRNAFRSISPGCVGGRLVGNIYRAPQCTPTAYGLPPPCRRLNGPSHVVRLEAPGPKDGFLLGQAHRLLEPRAGAPLHALLALAPRRMPHRLAVHDAEVRVGSALGCDSA